MQALTNKGGRDYVGGVLMTVPGAGAVSKGLTYSLGGPIRSTKLMEENIMSLLRNLAHAALFVVAMLGGVTAATGQTLTQFYGGRQVTLIVPTGPGGGYALYGQLFSRYLGKHIPGQPTVVVQYMPGGGGNVAANYLYNVAPKDGSVIASLFSTLTVTQALQPSGTQFDATKFSWLGSIAPLPTSIGVWYQAPAVTLDGVRKNQVVIGATGKSAELYIYPKLMNALLGTKFKIVLGYQSTGAILLAMQNGEVQGMAMGVDIWASMRPEWIKDKKVVMLAQTGLKRDKAMPDLPTLIELAKSSEDKQIMTFVASPAVLGRAVAAPPGIPQDRLTTLRKAFDDTMSDPEFRHDVSTRVASVDPRSGPEIAALIESVASTSKPVIERTKKLLGF